MPTTSGSTSDRDRRLSVEPSTQATALARTVTPRESLPSNIRPSPPAQSFASRTSQPLQTPVNRFGSAAAGRAWPTFQSESVLPTSNSEQQMEATTPAEPSAPPTPPRRIMANPYAKKVPARASLSSSNIVAARPGGYSVRQPHHLAPAVTPALPVHSAAADTTNLPSRTTTNQGSTALVLLGFSNFTIVRVNFCPGTTYEGELVKLVRDPQNRIDPNSASVNVFNSAGIKVGSLTAQEATLLAPLMDKFPSITVSATVAGPYRDNVPVKVRYFASQQPVELSFGALVRMLGSSFHPAPGTERYTKKPTPMQPPLSQPPLAAAQGHVPVVTSQNETTFFGTSKLTLVGMKFHTGYCQVSVGDQIKLVREPKNAYDANAIRADTLQGTPIGHVERQQAKLLSVLMDRHKPVQYVAWINGEQRYSAVPVKVQYAATPNNVPLYKAIYRSRLKSLFREPPRVSAQSASQSQTNPSSVAPETKATQFLGTSTMALLGMKDYSGYQQVRPGDAVSLVREPDNKHDKSAVRVDTTSGVTIGHVSGQHSKSLSVLMDFYPSIKISASVGGPKQYSSVPLTLHYACKTSEAPFCMRILQSCLNGQLREGDIGPPASTTYSNTSRKARQSRAIETRVETQAVDWETQREEIDKLFEKQSEVRLRDLPVFQIPAALSHLSFYDYQKQGIAWLINQEKGSIPSYLTESERNGQRVWKCGITGSVLYDKPKPVRGGILGDDMGTGKSIMTLALIIANPPGGHKTYPLPQKHGLDASDAPRTTLIVCPLSVMTTWQTQIDQHINRHVCDQNLSVLIYHGSNRPTVLSKIQRGEVDVVLATYQTLASDLNQMRESKNQASNLMQEGGAEKKKDDDDMDAKFGSKRPKKKQKSDLAIFDLCFHRLVLDEAHSIKNSKAKAFEAVCALNALRKRCLTGTPMVNGPMDLHSLLAFLQVQPLCELNVFTQFVVDPIKERREIGMNRLRTVMSYICLRRKKQSVMQSIQLVTKSVEIRRIDFPVDSEHKKTYHVLYETARSYFVDALETKGRAVLGKYMELIGLILRIRQACNHLALIPDDYRERASDLTNSVISLGTEEGSTLLAHLRGAFTCTELVECAVCMNELEEKDAVILRKCKHIFCESCLERIENQLCPLCRVSYSSNDMVKKQNAEAASKRPKVDAYEAVRRHDRSPKVQALLDGIDEMKPDEKGVIFSQWTSMLDIVAAEFKELGIVYTRIDGTMNPQARIQAMQAFDAESSEAMEAPRFILCSLMACNTGINLIRGNVVFMLDPWWNSAAESQAMDRVHRIGQTRPVRVIRLLMKDSIEERLVAYTQVSKAALGKGSLEKLDADEKRKARLTAMMDLFQVDPSKMELDWN